MNISYYIRELLFAKQSVYLPEIGTFEVESIPAKINEDQGIITPPSKIIRLTEKEGNDYSNLSSYIANSANITLQQADAAVRSFCEKIIADLKNGREVELDGIGTIRMLGSGKIIFLPISSYSSNGLSFGLPTITISAPDNLVRPHLIQNDAPNQDDQEEKTSSKKDSDENAEAIPPVPSEEEEVFELIDDFDTSVSNKNIETIQSPEGENSQSVNEETFVPNASDNSIDTNKSVQESKPLYLEVTSEEAADGTVEIKKSRFGWIWMFLVIICVLAIGLVALYHYNPKLFAFILPEDSTEVSAPTIPDESDSTYFQAITGSLKDTTIEVDSARTDSARIGFQVLDSLNKSKKAASPNVKSKNSLSSKEVEDIINEKLKQGLPSDKKADTQKIDTKTAKPTTTLQPKDTKPAVNTANTNGYNVIVASVRSQAEAQQVIANLKSKGFTGTILIGEKGKVRVSIGSYPNPKQAANAARVAKSKLNVEAWVLNP